MLTLERTYGDAKKGAPGPPEEDRKMEKAEKIAKAKKPAEIKQDVLRWAQEELR